uniref:Uncharacterized protein n=1 Tax=uncultured marine group II/III euryarchaeote KM3_16_D12 TaxID=1457926 RepID=A0A075GJ31_9EURY|nr:hypothetical protein [uncultured marine group II/III euryarchaeote KM3_16_D12]
MLRFERRLLLNMLAKDADETGGGGSPRKRGEYFGGTDEKPKEYVVVRCTGTPLHYASARPRGKEPREGCGGLHVIYTAKHHGHRDWQGNCPITGVQSRLHRGRIADDGKAVFQTREEANKFVLKGEIQRGWDDLNRRYWQGQDPALLIEIRLYAREHGFTFFEGDYE